MTKNEKRAEILSAAEKAAKGILALQFKGRKVPQKRVREVAAKMAKAIPIEATA
jgi:hypothetical protein